MWVLGKQGTGQKRVFKQELVVVGYTGKQFFIGINSFYSWFFAVFIITVDGTK